MLRIVSFAIMLVVVYAPHAFSESYYVDPNAPALGTGLSQAGPAKTLLALTTSLANSNASVQCGDTIFLLAGKGIVHSAQEYQSQMACNGPGFILVKPYEQLIPLKSKAVIDASTYHTGKGGLFVAPNSTKGFSNY